MTYCVAMCLKAGLLFASDSRTNAGVDHVATFRKMHRFEVPGQRLIVVLTAGNLATTQSVLALLRQRADADAQQRNLLTVGSLYEAACLLGETLREVIQRDGAALAQANIDVGSSFILGGQIAGELPRLFNIYPQGNFIEATPETPYFQIGESKYGKPIIDRIVDYQTPVMEAAQCALISFDSTIRSNLSVGPPVDLLCYERDALVPTLERRIGEDDAYFAQVRKAWSDGLRAAFAALPPLTEDSVS